MPDGVPAVDPLRANLLGAIRAKGQKPPIDVSSTGGAAPSSSAPPPQPPPRPQPTAERNAAQPAGPPVAGGPPDLLAAIRARGQKPAVDPAAKKLETAPPAVVKASPPPEKKLPAGGPPDLMAAIRARSGAGPGAAKAAAAADQQTKPKVIPAASSNKGGAAPPAMDLQSQIKAQAEARQKKQQEAAAAAKAESATTATTTTTYTNKPPVAAPVPPAKPTAPPKTSVQLTATPPKDGSRATAPSNKSSPATTGTAVTSANRPHVSRLSRSDSDSENPKIDMHKVKEARSGETVTSYRSGAIGQINVASKVNVGAAPPPPTVYEPNELQQKLRQRQQTLQEAAISAATAKVAPPAPPLQPPRPNVKSDHHAPQSLNDTRKPTSNQKQVSCEVTNKEASGSRSKGLLNRLLSRKEKRTPSPPKAEQPPATSTLLESADAPTLAPQSSNNRMLLPGFLSNVTTPPPAREPSGAALASFSRGRRKASGGDNRSGRTEEPDKLAPVFDPTGNYRLLTDPCEIQRAWNHLSCRVIKEGTY